MRDTTSGGLPTLDWLAQYPPPRSLALDQEAQRIYEHAYAIGLETEPPGTPPITYSTVIAALLSGGDETSRWFSGQTSRLGPDPAAVFTEKGTTREEIEGLIPGEGGEPPSVRLSTDRHLLTASARSVISNAEGWAQRVGGSDIGVRHLVAVYVLNPPPAHRAQMQQWGYREAGWRVAFFEWVAQRYTAEQWADARQRPAPTKALFTFESQEIKGAALAFAADARTQSVLSRAATIHAKRPDHWLRLQTVLHALIETARQDEVVREAIEPIADELERAGAEYDRGPEAGVPEDEPDVVPFPELDISPRVLNALETARDLAAATWRAAGDEPLVGVHHLAGALVSRRVDGAEEITGFGLDPHALRIAIIDHAVRTHGDPIDLWREALGEEEGRFAGRPVELNSDEPEAVVRLDEDWTDDPLGIRRDVETFAALLASKKLEPPLSIGLFGPWGSGKTTFLRRLRRAVQDRADGARQAAGQSEPTPYVSHVVHVDFNAWHYAESALTSSLVDAVFRALGDYIADDHQIAGREWQRQKLEALESTRRKVEAARAVEAAARSAVDAAEAELESSRADAAQAATGLRSALGAVWNATRRALEGDARVKESGVLGAVSDVTHDAAALRRRLETLRARPLRLLSDLGWARSILFAGLVLALPLLVAWLVGKGLGVGGASQALAMAATIISTLGVWARSAGGAVARVDAALSRVADDYAMRLETDPAVLRSTATLESARASAQTAVAGLEAARGELARAKTEVANATVPAQMLRLVSGRIDAESYSQELTTLSLARADLEALSRLLRDQRGGAASDAGETPPAEGDAKRAVDRVILYIDDLDRCKPEDVVRVLQVVHMLLAFELFVCVVAVDARWVEECLRHSFNWLEEGEQGAGGSDGSVPAQASASGPWITPQDYLEKIFQIAFWLEPMTASRAASFLGSLVRSPRRESGGPVYAAGSPAAVEIAGIELDYMRALAAYVGTSPRRVKRLVNAYRLIKAGLSEPQLKTFLTDRGADGGGVRSGPYQLVIGLLVIGTGAPSSSAHILGELAQCDPRTQADELVEQLRDRDHPDWTMAAQVVETLIRTQKMQGVSELRGWARKVGRFLLKRPASGLRAPGASGPEPAASSVGDPEEE